MLQSQAPDSWERCFPHIHNDLRKLLSNRLFILIGVSPPGFVKSYAVDEFLRDKRHSNQGHTRIESIDFWNRNIREMHVDELQAGHFVQQLVRH